jgi:hypothetical protein
LTFGKRTAGRALRRALRGLAAGLVRLGWHARPDFLIVGAQKAGTTALHNYLAGHPQIVPPFDKELYYFSPESFHAYPDYPGYERYSKIAQGDADPAIRRETLRWYHAQFVPPIPGRKRLTYESTTCYLYFPEVARRIRAYRPDMKLIVLLRDPVERAFSSWNMARQWTDYPSSLQQDKRSFEEAVREELPLLEEDPKTLTTDYLRRGIYHEQLRRYFEVFPREQVLIIDRSELLGRHAETMGRVCRFLGVRPFAGTDTAPRFNVGTYPSGMAPATREFLARFFAPHNEALFELIGREFEWTKPSGENDGESAVVTPPRTDPPAAR